MSRRNQSTVDVELVGSEWMVVQRMTAEDAVAVAHALGLNDGASVALLLCADIANTRNAEAFA